MINREKIAAAFVGWGLAKPFPYVVIDGFFVDEWAARLAGEFPAFDGEVWHEYSNPLEIKKTCNDWNRFPPVTYRTFTYLNSAEFVRTLSQLIEAELVSDIGLNGGGWHIHAQGGKLNPHLDYSMHPKLPLQRKINLLVYLNADWRDDWGGHLGLYAGDGKAPGALTQKIAPLYNRAVLFDTTQNSWHGLHDAIVCPEDQHRKSIALYYLTAPPAGVDERGKALFAPTKDQLGDKKIEALIRQRANVATAAKAYRVK